MLGGAEAGADVCLFSPVSGMRVEVGVCVGVGCAFSPVLGRILRLDPSFGSFSFGGDLQMVRAALGGAGLSPGVWNAGPRSPCSHECH